MAGLRVSRSIGLFTGPIRSISILLHCLEHRRLLLVLDGFEREQKSYASGYHPDHGDLPPGGDEQDARRCIDNHALRFLTGLCAGPRLRARVLITSRLFPAELEGVDREQLPLCRRLVLQDFSEADILDLFGHVGIAADQAEILELAAAYGRHPLAVRLLIGVIRAQAARRRGVAAALSGQVRAFCEGAGAAEAEVLAIPGNHFTPGFDPRYTAALCFLDRR